MYKEGGKKFVAPAHTSIACVFGALLLLAAAAIMFEKAARPVALLLGAIILS